MLLTIAIPHSHDIGSLKSTLECLKGQQHRDVEILVNDNALGQEFRDVMADMSQELRSLVYYENTKFQTYDQNVDNCVRQSKGDFVWLLGVGDIIPDGHVASALQQIALHPKALNLLPHVKIKSSVGEATTQNSVSQTAEPIWEGSIESKIALDTLYNAAISGNIIRREAWIEACQFELNFENWAHIERTLQMYSLAKVAQLGIRCHNITVIVDRPTQGWWNQNNISYLGNVLYHSLILKYYQRQRNLEKFKQANVLNGINFSLIKAYLYGTTIGTDGPEELKKIIHEKLRTFPFAFLLIKLLGLAPKRLLGKGYRIARSLKIGLTNPWKTITRSSHRL